ncbi:MAG: MBL fold metallo-hydrolase [Anaerolineae bacterium]
MKLTCLVDNSVAISTPFWGEHGFSVLIESEGKRLLFDTGASGTVLLHNLALLEVPAAALDAVVFSHSHYDHTGGLALLLAERPGLAVYAHPGVMRPRFSQGPGHLHPIGMPMPRVQFAALADLRLSAEPAEVLPGIWTTGQIKERPEPEGRGKGHMVQEGDAWLPDPYEDDQALVLRTPEGLTLLLGCCHAGLLNTIEHTRRIFGAYPTTIIGGTHLAAANEAYLEVIARRLEEIGAPMLYPCHCTGPAAFARLSALLSGHLAPWGVGDTLEI